MDNNVKSALTASLDHFARNSGEDANALKQELLSVFSKQAGFLDKVTEFDSAFDEYPAFEELREVFFDLMMINFFASDVKMLEEDYLDSDEWANIEEETIDRGTELLNLLLYINECHDEKIRPELDDFLKEFLLVEEDEFQDEFHIYEDLISNQSLIEGSIEDICSHAGMLEISEEMQELFVPFMTFFHSLRATPEVVEELEQYSGNPAYDSAVYVLIANFNDNKI
jgi:hypothetical protein